MDGIIVFFCLNIFFLIFFTNRRPDKFILMPGVYVWYKIFFYCLTSVIFHATPLRVNYYKYLPVRGYDTSQTSSGRTSKFNIRSPISSYFGGNRMLPGLTSIKQFSTPNNSSIRFPKFSSSLLNLICILFSEIKLMHRVQVEAEIFYSLLKYWYLEIAVMIVNRTVVCTFS